MAGKAPGVLITLTAPSCSGKSYLFNYIRDVAKLPCLISTTTRAPREGEIEGVDYYFISETTSQQFEENNQFAELANYRGVRYGVTKPEFHSKLSQGVAFLIVEPSGIDHYVKPALEAGAAHLKYYIHTDFDLRMKRLQDRAMTDIRAAVERWGTMGHGEQVEKVVRSYMDRIVAASTVEQRWGETAQWDRILFGTSPPEENLRIIMSDVAKKQAHLAELEEFANAKRLKNSIALEGRKNELLAQIHS